MQGRAAAVYGLVFLLVAAGAFAFVSTAEAPEPSIENPDYELQTNETFTVGDRTYTVDSFSEAAGSPVVTFTWTDETTRASQQWTHAEEPGADPVTYDGAKYWVRIPRTDSPDSFTLLEVPAEDSGVSVFTDSAGTWVVNDSGEYVDLEDYDGLERVEVENGSTITTTVEEESQEVHVDAVSNSSVILSWNSPSKVEAIVRQATRSELNGRNVTVHVPEQGSVHVALGDEKIDDYLQQHDDRDKVETRHDGLRMTAALGVIATIILMGLAFLPRKE